MTFLSGLIAQILHVALIGAAAPTIVGMQGWMLARLAGRTGPSPMQPWWDLARLLRKQTLLAESSSRVTSDAPVVGVSVTAVAACLVPSFTLGMTFAPFADLLLISGLLMMARVSLSLVAMDAGTTAGGLGASRVMLLVCLAEPAFLLVLFVMALLAGSLNLDVVAAMQLENAGGWRAHLGISLAAVILIALVDAMREPALAFDLSGRDLGPIEAADALRLMVWFNLIGAAFLPFGMAPASAGPVAWAIGILAWLCRTAVFAGALVLLRAWIGRTTTARAVNILGIAAVLGVLGAVLVLADMRPV